MSICADGLWKHTALGGLFPGSNQAAIQGDGAKLLAPKEQLGPTPPTWEGGIMRFNPCSGSAVRALRGVC